MWSDAGPGPHLFVFAVLSLDLFRVLALSNNSLSGGLPNLAGMQYLSYAPCTARFDRCPLRLSAALTQLCVLRETVPCNSTTINSPGHY